MEAGGVRGGGGVAGGGGVTVGGGGKVVRVGILEILEEEGIIILIAAAMGNLLF